MQFIFFVPPNVELEGTLHPQKCGCTPKNEGKRVHVPPDEKTCGHTDYIVLGFTQTRIKLTIYHLECNDIPNDDTSQYFIDHTVQGPLTILMTRYDWVLLMILMPRYDWMLLTILAILFQQIISLVSKPVKIKY
jgi:hypothetical protein